MGDDEFVARLVAADRSGELRDCFPRKPGSVLALLGWELVQEPEHGVSCLGRELLTYWQVRDVVTDGGGELHADAVEPFADQPGGLFGTGQRPVVDRRQQ